MAGGGGRNCLAGFGHKKTALGARSRAFGRQPSVIAGAPGRPVRCDVGSGSWSWAVICSAPGRLSMTGAPEPQRRTPLHPGDGFPRLDMAMCGITWRPTLSFRFNQPSSAPAPAGNAAPPPRRRSRSHRHGRRAARPRRCPCRGNRDRGSPRPAAAPQPKRSRRRPACLCPAQKAGSSASMSKVR